MISLAVLIIGGLSVDPARAQFRQIVRARSIIRVVATTPQNIKIPVGTHRVYVRLWGAAGGAGGSVSPTVLGGTGGGGAYASAEFKLSGLDNQNAFYFSPGVGGRGGLTSVTGSPSVIVGRGGSGGSPTQLLQTDGRTQLLVAAGGAGGGGASGPKSPGAGSAGGAGGAGGFTQGQPGVRGCNDTGCANLGNGASVNSSSVYTGGSAGTMVGQACNLISVLLGGSAQSLQPSTSGSVNTDGSTSNEGGAAGTCYSGTVAYLNGDGIAYYDNAGTTTGCVSGAGGGGRAGGGAGGVNSTPGYGCAGGGGGVGYFAAPTGSSFRASADGAGPVPGLATDRDLVAAGGTYAQGGQPSPYVAANGAASGTGGAGGGGFAVFYFW